MGEIVLELPELTFREKDHQYFLNGINIPSVSRVLEPAHEKAYGRINQFVLDRAAAKGTEVHRAIEYVNKYGIIDISDDNRPYLDAYVSWADINKPVSLASEIRIYHPVMRYAGTVDSLSMINGVVTLIDYKTSQKVIDDIYMLQTEAYRQALLALGVEVGRKLILQLKKDRTFREYEYELNDVQAFSGFCGYKAVYDWENRKRRIL